MIKILRATFFVFCLFSAFKKFFFVLNHHCEKEKKREEREREKREMERKTQRKEENKPNQRKKGFGTAIKMAKSRASLGSKKHSSSCPTAATFPKKNFSLSSSSSGPTSLSSTASSSSSSHPASPPPVSLEGTFFLGHLSLTDRSTIRGESKGDRERETERERGTVPIKTLATTTIAFKKKVSLLFPNE